MKKFLFLFISFLFVLCACTDKGTTSKDIGYMNSGIITGADLRECACCGGWFIDIDKVKYRFYALPQGAGFNLDTCTFPVYIDLDWSKPDKPCMSDLITVIRARKRN